MLHLADVLKKTEEKGEDNISQSKLGFNLSDALLKNTINKQKKRL